MELALTVLISTTLTCVGLLALWAARSPWHWFLRTAVFLGVFAPLLLIPAFEPFVAFALQGAIVIAGVQLAQKRLRIRSFSLATLLQSVVLVALAAAVASKAPTINLAAWVSVFLVGLAGGLSTLVGYWIFAGRFKCWWMRLIFGLIATWTIAIPAVLGDSFVGSFLGLSGWPPEGMQWFGQEEELPTIWLIISSLVTCCVSLVLYLAFKLRPDVVRAPQNSARRYGSFVGNLITPAIVIALVVPPLVTYYKLLTPLPIPETVLPVPNGYDDIVAAGQMLEGTAIELGNIYYDEATLKQLRAMVAEVGSACERCRKAFEKECRSPADYTSMDAFDASMQVNMRHRDMARAFAATARLARIDGDYETALSNSLDAIRLGFATRKGGLLVDAFVGIGSSRSGFREFFQVCNHLTEQQCKTAIEQLLLITSDVESIEEFLYRDRIWSQHASGWHGHVLQFLSELTDYYPIFDPEDFPKPFRRENAILRLFVVDLAVRGYRSQHGRWPTSLEELASSSPDIDLADPFDPNDRCIRYQSTEAGYLIYSVGPDGIDNEGTSPKRDEFDSLDYSTGDLRLDIEFAPSEITSIEQLDLEVDESSAK